MIGSNYIYPKETNREVKALLEKHGGETVGEEYAPLGHTEFSTIINKIAGSGADVVFSDPGGRSDRRLLQAVPAVRHHRRGPADLHADHDRAGDRGDGAGERARPLHLVQLLPDGRHARRTSQFVERYKAKYGEDQVTNAVMEAAYFQTYLLAQAIEKVGSTDTDALIFDGLPGQEFKAPQGPVKIDEKNHHTWLWARIGKAREDGQFDIVWTSEDRIRPDPWVDLLYPNKDCDFTDPQVLERLKSSGADKNRSGTIDL